MKSATSFVIVLVTVPKITVARKLARAALGQKLIACANIVPRLESHYWWQGKLEKSTECLLILKTRKSLLHKLESVILSHHPYDTPEIIALPLTSGTGRYLDWLLRETTSPG